MKTSLLEAMNLIRVEYETQTHSATMSSCALCNLYYKMFESCSVCPMKVFKGKSYGCLNRRCAPLTFVPAHGQSQYRLKTKLQAVIEFYELAIAKVETMTEEELNQPRCIAFAFLVDLDNEIADKYKLFTRRKSDVFEG